MARSIPTTGALRWARLAICTWPALALLGQVPDPRPPRPQPPCAATPVPPYPALDATPTLMAWDPAGLGRDWTPPACTGWTEPGFTSLVAMTARFHHASGVAGLLQRAGAISAYTGMHYWSVTGQRWKTLVVHSNALTGVAGHSRKDFGPEELTPGSTLYFEQEDNMSGKASYRMRIIAADAERLVFATENISTMHYLLWPLFKPGELQSIYYFQRETATVWRFYSLARTGRKASTLTTGHDASSENRSVALFRYLAGIPTDQEPPGVPR